MPYHARFTAPLADAEKAIERDAGRAQGHFFRTLVLDEIGLDDRALDEVPARWRKCD